MVSRTEHDRLGADDAFAVDGLVRLARLTHTAKDRLSHCAELIERISHELTLLPQELQPRPETLPSARDKLLSLDEVAARLGISTVTLMKLRKAGRWPEPIHISPRRRAYREAEIDQWLLTKATPDT